MADSPTQLALPDLDAAATKVPSGLWATLTHKEQCFVAAMLADPRRTQVEAARIAGISERRAKTGGGSEMANRPQVKAALACAREEVIATAKRDGEAVIALLWDNAEAAKEDGQYAASTQAASVLAKVYGLAEKRVRLTVDNPEAALTQLKAMPKAERVAVLRDLLGV